MEADTSMLWLKCAKQPFKRQPGQLRRQGQGGGRTKSGEEESDEEGGRDLDAGADLHAEQRDVARRSEHVACHHLPPALLHVVFGPCPVSIAPLLKYLSKLRVIPCTCRLQPLFCTLLPHQRMHRHIQTPRLRKNTCLRVPQQRQGARRRRRGCPRSARGRGGWCA